MAKKQPRPKPANQTISKYYVSADCVIFGYDENENKLEVLLIEHHDPAKDTASSAIFQLALPGNLVKENEDLDDAAIRVIKELANLDGIRLEQFHAFGDLVRFKSEKDKKWLKSFDFDHNNRVVTIGYSALVRKETIKATPGSFAKTVSWRNTKRIPTLAFDHNAIVKKALSVLKDNVYQPYVPQRLLPKKFTLRQLQNLYEILLDTELDKRNFIKRVKKDENLIPLGEKQKGVTHKPAQLYSFKSRR